MESQRTEEIRQVVRDRYGRIAGSPCPSCGGAGPSSCCGPPNAGEKEIALALGYTADDIDGVPEGANMGLGCGNPQSIAELKPGERVLDLGSGGGFDCFLAARQVGPEGFVIGVDMTAAMVAKARENASKAEVANVEFRLGEIEHLPVADESIDLIISNCVINLSPDKAQVFRDAFRVLRPGGRIAISDVVAAAALPESVRSDLALVASCIGGAQPIDHLEDMLRQAGFEEIEIRPREESRALISQWVPGGNMEDYIMSAIIKAVKPKRVDGGPAAGGERQIQQ